MVDENGGGGAEGAVTISTGQTVELPVRAEAEMLGAAFAAPRAAVSTLLPDELRPLRATPTGGAAVALLSVEYRRIGVDGIDPYDEFAVVVPATPRSSTVGPSLSTLRRPASGYVWYMPVTTDPARAFGADVWGFPKAVAEVTHDDAESVRRTTVTVDGDRFVTLEVARPPAVRWRGGGYAYAVADGRPVRVPTDVDARVGLWPFTRAASATFGDHERAAPLRSLDFGSRALARLSLDGEVRLHRGEPLR